MDSIGHVQSREGNVDLIFKDDPHYQAKQNTALNFESEKKDKPSYFQKKLNSMMAEQELNKKA